MTEKISVSLDEKTQKIVRRVVRERNYGKRGFSLALRQIVNEWEKANSQSSEPSLAVSADTRELVAA